MMFCAVGNQRTQPVAAPAVEERDRRRGGHCEVALLAPRRPEVQAGRHVDHQPCLQLAVGDHLPDVRVGGACGHRPVHPPDVVAGLVKPRLARLAPGPGIRPRWSPCKHAVELAPDRQLQFAQRRRQLWVANLAALQRR